MRVLIVEPGEYPREAEIEDTLEAEQAVVGGLIECVYPWADNAILVCDDEGLINGKPFNRAVTDQILIAGTFFICSQRGENFASLTDKQISKYKEMLLSPQVAVRKDGVIQVRSCSPKLYRMIMGQPLAPKKDGPHER